MYNFTYHVPTRIHFGKGQIMHLSEMKESGSKALLVYGGGSIKASGIYNEAMKILSDSEIEVFELSGVEPNPRIESVRDGVALCKEHEIEMVLAIGGGSVIDCAKIIAAGAKSELDPWELVLDGSKITDALPIYTVLTLSATGSEMDSYAVISDMTKNEKWGTGAECLKPTMSVLDPEYTYTVSKKQTAAGLADIMSHTMENYFSKEDAEFQKNLAEGILRTCITCGPVAMEEPRNYQARASIMWASSHAINGLVGEGSANAWCVHPMEHELSAFYDITHGEGLAILTPAWMDEILDLKTAPMLARFGREVYGLDPSGKSDDYIIAREAIAFTRKFFFEKLGMPHNLRAVGITDDSKFEIMAEKAAKQCSDSVIPLSAKTIEKIYRRAF